MSTIGHEMTFNRFQGDQLDKMLLRAATEFYEKKGGWKHITIIEVKGRHVLAENQQDAEEIYKIATKQE